MIIGILKETVCDNRVVFLPEHIARLKKLKIELLVEKDAGINSFVSNKQYEEAGAIIKEKDEIINQSDVIGRINSFSNEEIKQFGEGKVVFGFLNALVDKESIIVLKNRKLTSFSLEIIPRTTRAQAMDILSSMATVAGYKAVLEAASYLPKFFPMFMSAAGTIKPAKVLILGAGVAGLQAIAIARKLGAVVEVFDVRSAVKDEVKSLGGKFIEIEGAKDDAAAGGYAVEQTDDFKQKQQQAIHDHAVKSNVIISTAQIPGRKAPLLIKKDTVENMVPGSVIIDLAASTGGNCELSKNDEIVIHKQVKIIGNSNYASKLPQDSSRMFGNNVINFVSLLVDDDGNLKLDFEDEIVKGTCVTHNGEIISERVKSFIN